jgi:hypothetical protein
MPIKKLAGLLLLALLSLAIPADTPAQVAVGISVHIGPPALPVYAQPVCPGEGYIWTPGYWAYGPDGYYWVPGTWVIAPTPGFLWTPGYWGGGGGVYVWHAGYWGRTWASTAELIMAMATAASGSLAANGAAELSTTTPPSPM